MKQQKTKVHLICDAENSKPFAVVTGKKPSKFKNNPDIVCKTSEDFIAGLTALSETVEEAGGKIRLSSRERSIAGDLCQGMQVRYILPDSKESKRSVLSDYIPDETYNSLDNLLEDSAMTYTCKVHVFQYCIYADREIPINEIRDCESFIQKLETPEYRKKYGVFLIVQEFNWSFDFRQGVIFFDAAYLAIMQETQFNKPPNNNFIYCAD